MRDKRLGVERRDGRGAVFGDADDVLRRRVDDVHLCPAGRLHAGLEHVVAAADAQAHVAVPADAEHAHLH